MRKKVREINFNYIKFKLRMFSNELSFFYYSFQRKKLKLFKFFDQRKIGSIPRILLSSIIVILFFYLAPILNNYGNSSLFNTTEYKNKSKAVLAYTLNKKNSGLDDNEKILDEKDLLFDIFSLNDLETDTVRLDASTIKQLFDDTNYKLNDVRETKLVKPVALTLLPNEIKMIENTTERKELFIQIILPLILEENNNIKLDRRTLFNIINKSNNTKLEKKWLEKKYKQYGVVSKDLSTLKIRMDEVPVSLAIAQAAKETGWGTSRFAQEGNALFGQWTWSGEGLKPKEADENKGHKVMKFNVLQASVRAYQRNLNTHRSYKNFRLARAELRDQGKPLDSMILSKFLDNYAETGEKYVEVLQKIIKQNNLKDFDDSKLLPSSKDLESLT
jgi:Bax protein